MAGGLILLALAVRELVGFGPQDRGGSDEFGVVPLGMPLIAGPALLTALLFLSIPSGSFLRSFTVCESGACRPCALQCGTVRALDGQARPAWRLENHRASPRCHRHQPDPARLADALSAAHGSCVDCQGPRSLQLKDAGLSPDAVFPGWRVSAPPLYRQLDNGDSAQLRSRRSRLAHENSPHDE